MNLPNIYSGTRLPKFKQPKNRNNQDVISADILNNFTFIDFFDRLKRVATSIFKWKNLPETMNERWLELCLFYKGMAGILKHDDYGIINTEASWSGNIDIYGLPTLVYCYSTSFFSEQRVRYDGKVSIEELSKIYGIQNDNLKEAILVMNNIDMQPTFIAMELFAYRLYKVQRTIDINLDLIKKPFIIGCNEQDKLSMQKFMMDVENNQNMIFATADFDPSNSIKIFDLNVNNHIEELENEKRAILSEALTTLGVNSILVDKAERLISDEGKKDNEFINYNLQYYWKQRKEACEQFNKLFKPEKEIEVVLNSDINNIIKQEFTDYKSQIDDFEGGDFNGNGSI
jgi:hypothetical protein